MEYTNHVPNKPPLNGNINQMQTQTSKAKSTEQLYDVKHHSIKQTTR